MIKFGLITFATDYGIQPAELGRWAEGAGYESLFFAEHTHIPTSRKSPFGGGGPLPDYYKQAYDPFVALAAVAAATEILKVGTAICLVTEHNPITLAKTVASLDRVSNGRVILGIGAGWNAEEMFDHGVDFKDRWKVTRERVLAMREIWNNEVAEYHGDFVDFEPTWSWPKPVQAGGPPILLGARSKWVPDRVAEYCDGWFPIGTADQLAPLMEQVKAKGEQAGRDELDMTLCAWGRSDPFLTADEVNRAVEMGFRRIVLHFEPQVAERQRAMLKDYQAYVRQFASIG